GGAPPREGGPPFFATAKQGGTPRRITTSQAIDTEAEFSADGRWLYFTSDRGGGPQIYRMPAGGGTAGRVTFSGSYNVSPTVSPDGRTLAYVSRNGNGFRLATL